MVERQEFADSKVCIHICVCIYIVYVCVIMYIEYSYSCMYVFVSIEQKVYAKDEDTYIYIHVRVYISFRHVCVNICILDFYKRTCLSVSTIQRFLVEWQDITDSTARVCICIYIYICAYVHMYIYVNMRVYVCKYMCT